MSSKSDSGSNRAALFREFYFDRLIRTRVLEGLQFEDVPRKIQDVLQVRASRGRGIRQCFIKWGWLTVTPSVVHVTEKPFQEFFLGNKMSHEVGIADFGKLKLFLTKRFAAPLPTKRRRRVT